MPSHSRRNFLKNTLSALAATPLVSRTLAEEHETPPLPNGGVTIERSLFDGNTRWLDGAPPPTCIGSTWGMPWPRGELHSVESLSLKDQTGTSIPTQSWPLAWWPDGSLKWTAHAVPPGTYPDGPFTVAPGPGERHRSSVTIHDSDDAVVVDTGAIRCVIPKTGGTLISTVQRSERIILKNCRLILASDRAPTEPESPAAAPTETFTSQIERVSVEQSGPVRAVVKIEGKHQAAGRTWMPFVVRFYFFAGGDAIRVMHSFIFDGDPNRDFVRGIGLRFDVAMSDLQHDRHVRFMAENRGVWGEAIRGLTGLGQKPDLNGGTDIESAQVAGRACPPLETFNPFVRDRLDYIPLWGDVTLQQTNANGFTIRKRTKSGHGWIDADQGVRASGTGYIGGARGGGVSFGLRDFWQRHPVQLDIRHAQSDSAETTLWMYSPAASPMDLRFYHDGMGMDTFDEQVNGGLRTTYEDYEPGFGDAHGIARSSELFLWIHASTPSREELADLAEMVQRPPQLVCTPERLVQAGVFAGLCSLPDRSTPARAAIERRLDWEVGYYIDQVRQRHWYGFWHYGDVMHTYDSARHVWRYDVGGFAWDNSELSTDLWLWMFFLRSGRPDIFRLAEAMTRHTSEVDVYHAGRFSGLGSRHNVQHWGCSAKQVRISTPAYRRIYYYLTADERVGDLMREVLDVDAKLNAVDPVRKIHGASPLGPYDARLSFGVDWANLAAAWLTEWERGGDLRYRDKLLRGMRDLGAMPLGLFTSDRYGYKIADGSLEPLTLRGRAGTSPQPIDVSHLDAVFGAVEIFAELIQLTEGQPDYAGFKQAWLQYCRLYNAPREERMRELGVDVEGNSLRQSHSRLTAYAASMTADANLAARAWSQFARNDYRDERGNVVLATRRIEGTDVLNPVDEAPWVSTNISAQWGLAAIENLALIGDHLT